MTSDQKILNFGLKSEDLSPISLVTKAVRMGTEFMILSNAAISKCEDLVVFETKIKLGLIPNDEKAQAYRDQLRAEYQAARTAYEKYKSEIQL